MKSVRTWAALASVGLVVSGMAAAGGMSSAGAATAAPTRTALAGSLTPASERAHPAGKVSGASSVSFDLDLALQNAAGAEAAVKAVSDPTSAQYRHYLSDAQWESRFGPTQAEVRQAESWLRQNGFKVGALPRTGLYVPARGTAAQVEKAFSTTLGIYKVNGNTVRLANSTLSIPSSIAGAVSGVIGVNQYIETTNLTEVPVSSATKVQPDQEPPPPASFVNPEPCAKYWGQKTDTTDNASLYEPYSSPLPYDICGYLPSQLRSAYGINPSVDNGAGVTIAVVDAYDSPTLLSDVQEYFSRNDPANPLTLSQYYNVEPPTVDDQAECAASGWYDEQALDIESSHAMAPGANILFVGAQDCLDTSLLAALQTAITSGASVVTDSWGDILGDLLDDAASKTAYDDSFMLADATGVSVLFSSGDTGDNFADFGLAAPDYPPASPFITAVGGTTLEVNKSGNRKAEYGWSTAKQVLCLASAPNCGSATTPIGALNWQAGGGGGTSYYYTQPYYQAGVVPAALALRNEALFGPVPLRVEPDISMDADAQSGMLIGLTETFPNGRKQYGQFKEGGTSLASPLLAGVVADTDEAAGVSLGFLNPTLYKAYSETPSAFNDIVPPANALKTAVLRVDFANTQNRSDGFEVSLRAIDYEGPETYCDGTGNCATRDVTLSTGPGFDSLTGLGSVGPNWFSALSKF